MISIIVPVHNLKRFLIPCVNSILDSTYRDYELLLVDDGSTDGSGEICDTFAAQDSRIRVIHKANGGLSDARNAGIEATTGDFILFIDGDDVIHPNMIQVLHDAIQSGDYDFSMIHGVVAYDKQYEPLLKDKNLGLNASVKEVAPPRLHVWFVDNSTWTPSVFLCVE